MGMADADADRVMAALAAARSAYHDAPAAKAVEDKGKYVTEQASKHLSDAGTVVAREQRELERAHASLLEKAGLTPASAPPAPIISAEPRVIPVVAVARPAVTVAAKTDVSAASAAAPVAVPASAPTPASVVARVPQPATQAEVFPPPPVTPDAPPPPNLPMAPLEVVAEVKPAVVPAPVAAPVAAAVAAKPAPAMLPPAARSVPAPIAPPQQTMTDIQAAPRLTGPVDELRQLTVEDFRRLSRDPREATLKIKDKVDLLEDLGFETKSQGIKAFLESPINRLYLDILRASLEGKPVPDVIAALEARGAPTLDKPEFDALMDLNRRLRFG
jgi:hypothetical protein